MRKLKPGSPFLRGVKPLVGKRSRRPKSALLKHRLAPPSIKATYRLFRNQGKAYHPGEIRRPWRYPHASASLALTNR